MQRITIYLKDYLELLEYKLRCLNNAEEKTALEEKIKTLSDYGNR